MKILFFKKKKNIVFIGVFSFLRGRSKLTHVVFHSILPFLVFLGQVIHFCKSPYLALIYIIEAFAEKLIILAYWHVLKNEWQKQGP